MIAMLNRKNREPNRIGELALSAMARDHEHSSRVGGSIRRGADTPTPLALFVRRRLEELDLKQSDFCRQTGFDQGLLSKIQNSIISSLSLESTLRLALGLNVSPKILFGLTERSDMQELVLSAYALEFFPELSEMTGSKIPTPVYEITMMALSAHAMGRSLEPASAVLSHLSSARRGSRERPTSIAGNAEGSHS